MSYILDTVIQLGSTKVNLPLAATFLDTTGTAILGQSGITSFFKEIGLGIYQWHYNNYPDSSRGAIVIHAPSGNFTAPYTSFAINPSEVENADVKTSSVITSGNGANTIIVPVTDGTNALQNITVSLALNSITYRAITNSSGLATFNLDNGIYTRAAFYPGYNFGGDSVVISTNATLSTVVMNKLVATQPSAGFVRLYGYINDLGLQATTGVEMIVTASGCSPSYNGIVYIPKHGITSISDSNGFMYVDVVASGIPLRIFVPKCGYDRYYLPTGSGIINIANI